MINYGRELKMGVDIRRIEKIEKVTEFGKRIKKSIEKSRSSIKKGTRRDKVASRQRKERNRRIEEEE